MSYSQVMDPIAGGLATVMVLSCYVTSNLWVAGGGSTAVAGGVHIAGWAAQVYGHSAYEGRAPALLDNLFQVGQYTMMCAVGCVRGRLSKGNCTKIGIFWPCSAQNR